MAKIFTPVVVDPDEEGAPILQYGADVPDTLTSEGIAIGPGEAAR